MSIRGSVSAASRRRRAGIRGWGLLLWLAIMTTLIGGCGPTATVAVAPSPAAQEPTATMVPPTVAAAVATSTPVAPPTAPPAPTTTAQVPTVASTLPPTVPPTRPPTATVPAAVPSPTANTIVVPSAPPEPEARPVPIAVGQDIASEVATFFAAFYKARTLARGGAFDLPTTRGLTAAPYQEYTVTLLQKDADDAAAGKLLTVTYSGIATTVDNWQGSGGTGTALVSVTRTMTTVRSDGALAPQTATYQFRLRRSLLDQTHVSWVAYDFFNPGANAWVSALTAPTNPSSIDGELAAFFKQFYALREVAPGGAIDINANEALTAFAYREYTVPILQQQQDEIARKQLTSIRYTNIGVKLVNWDTAATNHGGIATVEVTRTSLVVRPGGAEAPQTATYQFRLHRHTDETGKGYWLAVDFFNPNAGRWVSESAGQPWIVPPSGHG